MRLINIRKRNPKKAVNFSEFLAEKNCKVGIELYENLVQAVEKFENSKALEEFTKHVEKVDKMENYFEIKWPVNRFKKRIRKEYEEQIQMVLAEVEKDLLNIYAKKYLEQETQKIISVNGSSSRSVLVRENIRERSEQEN